MRAESRAEALFATVLAPEMYDTVLPAAFIYECVWIPRQFLSVLVPRALKRRCP
jgi:hypothetical protein